MNLTKASSERNRAHPLKAVAGDDGHNYYVINATGARGVANVHYLAYYSSLNEYSPEELGGKTPTGFFFVRDAASSGPDHYGDPTVKAGWAMYIWDVAKYIPGVQNSGWIKIAQKGDVDWDVTDELKAMFVLKTVYNARVNDVDNRFEQDEAIVASLSRRVTIVETKIDEIYPLAHSHFYYDESGTKQGENLSVLNRLDDKYKCLYYRGKPIGGNSYIYDHVEYSAETAQKEIVWCDPTLDESEWTHEVVKNSDEIAQRILQTDIARIGLSLFVIEVDGSVTVYKYDRGTVVIDEGVTPGTIPTSVIWNPDNRVMFDPYAWPSVNITNLHPRSMYLRRSGIADWERVPGWLGKTAAQIQEYIDEHMSGQSHDEYEYSYIEPTTKLVYKFAQTIVPENMGLAEYVMTLPTATKWHYKRGCWVPLTDDGEHTVGHLHVCEEEPIRETLYHDASGEEYVTGTDYYQENASGEIVRAGAIITKRVLYPGSITTYRTCIESARRQNNGKPILRATDDPTKICGYRYYWKDIQSGGGSLTITGATPIIYYAEDATMWKDVYIYWKDPVDTTVGSKPVKWAKTVLVRKTGSAPENMLDGIQVMASTTRDKFFDAPFHESIPYSVEPVYYRLFSTSKAGEQYALSDAFTAEKLDWTKLLKAIRDGYASKLLNTVEYYVSTDAVAEKASTAEDPYYFTYDSVSDTYNVLICDKGSSAWPTGETIYKQRAPSKLILPTHSVYGDIECEVIGIGRDTDVAGSTRNCVLLMASKTVCRKFIDAVELTYSSSPTDDTTRVDGKRYFKRTPGGSPEYTEDLSTVNPAAAGLYEMNPEYSGATFSSGRGSNGAVTLESGACKWHDLSTTNIHRWLNSVETDWYGVGATLFDQPGTTDSYQSEAGFFGGFSDTSMFLSMGAYESSIAGVKLPTCKVSLPCFNSWYWKNISPRKTTGRFSAGVSWGTFYGAPETATDSKRRYAGFYDGKDKLKGTMNVIGPDIVTNILPIFMIG